MKLFAIVVFGLHTCFELLFGLNALISGASSSQTAEQIAANSVQMTTSFRFLGSALTALGVMGAICLFGPGVQSTVARYFAMGFVVFHGVGALGSLYTAAPGFEAYTAPLSLGALVLHGLLAIGFAVIVVARLDRRA